MSAAEFHNAFAAVVLIVAGCSLWVLDALLAREHREHIAEWYADGQPVGAMWRPPNVGSMWADVTRGRLVAVRLTFRWLVETPAWVRGDARALMLFRVYRVCSWVWVIGLPIVIVWDLAFGP
jgi:hypothetical protein